MALTQRAKEAAETTETTTKDSKPAETKEVAVKKSAAAPAGMVAGASVFITNPDILEAVADATYGMFPSVTASNGTHMCGDDDLGKTLKFQAILAKDVWKVAPGSNDEEAKDYFAVSEDGEVTKDGKPLQEALQDALDAGYSKAAIKKYIDVVCIVADSDNGDFIGETVTLQLSPSSQYTWNPLAGRCKMKAALGKLKAEPVVGAEHLGNVVVFTSVATPTKYKGNDFTKFEFSV